MTSEQLQKYIIRNGKDKTSQKRIEVKIEKKKKIRMIWKNGKRYFSFFISWYTGLFKFFYP